MNREWLERLQRQLRPESSIGVMAAVVALTALAAWLYLLKPAFAQYRALDGATSEEQIARSAALAQQNGVEIAALEGEIATLRERLTGGSSELPIEQMESFVIDRLDQISARRGVQLTSVTPGGVARVLMFDELVYDVDVRGDYFALYAWLQDVERELRPMAVKHFEMSGARQSGRVDLRLRLVSYRPQEYRS